MQRHNNAPQHQSRIDDILLCAGAHTHLDAHERNTPGSGTYETIHTVGGNFDHHSLLVRIPADAIHLYEPLMPTELPSEPTPTAYESPTKAERAVITATIRADLAADLHTLTTAMGTFSIDLQDTLQRLRDNASTPHDSPADILAELRARYTDLDVDNAAVLWDAYLAKADRVYKQNLRCKPPKSKHRHLPRVPARKLAKDLALSAQLQHELRVLGHNASDRTTPPTTPNPRVAEANQELNDTNARIKSVRKAQRAESAIKTKRDWQARYPKDRRKGHNDIFVPALGDRGIHAVLHPELNTVETTPEGIVDAYHAYFRKLCAPVSGPRTGLYRPQEAPRNYPWEQAGAPDAHFHLQGTTSPLITEALSLAADPTAFAECVRTLACNKAPGPDGYTNELLKALPAEATDHLHTLLLLMWVKGETPRAWTTSDTVLIPKPAAPDSLRPQDRRPIALANTTYKLWTSLVTRCLTRFALQHNIYTSGQEGFLPSRNTERQVLNLVHAIEDAGITGQDLYALYIDFSSAFNTIDHDKLLCIMWDLGVPEDLIRIVSNLYRHARTRVRLPHPLPATPEIDIQRGTIQGDTLSPALFILFIEPLLRWLHAGGRGYRYGCLTPAENDQHQLSSAAYADDLAILTNELGHMQTQAKKVALFSDWAGLHVNHSKCRVTAILHKTLKAQAACHWRVRTRVEGRVLIGGTAIPYLEPSEPFKYLGVHIPLTLDWGTQLSETIKTLKRKGTQLATSLASPDQRLQIIRMCLQPAVAYAMAVMPYTPRDIALLDRTIANIARSSYGLKPGFPTRALLLPTDQFGLGVGSMLPHYLRKAAAALANSLNDPGRLGVVTRALLDLQHRHAGTVGDHTHKKACRFYTTLKQCALLRSHGFTLMNAGHPYAQQTNSLLALAEDAPKDYTEAVLRQVLLLSELGVDLHTLRDRNNPGHLISTTDLRRVMGHAVDNRHLHALNTLCLLINQKPRQGPTLGPLPLADRRLPSNLQLSALESSIPPQPLPSPLITEFLSTRVVTAPTPPMTVEPPQAKRTRTEDAPARPAARRPHDRPPTWRDIHTRMIDPVAQRLAHKASAAWAEATPASDERNLRADGSEAAAVERHAIILSQPFIEQLMKGVPKLGTPQIGYYPRPRGYKATRSRNGTLQRDWKLAVWQLSQPGQLPAPPKRQGTAPLNALAQTLYNDIDCVEAIVAGPFTKVRETLYEVRWRPTVVLNSLLPAYAALGYHTQEVTPAGHAATPYGEVPLSRVEWKNTEVSATLLQEAWPDLLSTYLARRDHRPLPPRPWDAHLNAQQRQGNWATAAPPSVLAALRGWVTLDPLARNPDTDVNPNAITSHRIQLGVKRHANDPTPTPTAHSPAHVYDPEGRCLGTLTKERLYVLWQRFQSAATPARLRKWRLPPTLEDAFPEAVGRLLLRYTEKKSARAGKHVITARSEQALDPQVAHALARAMPEEYTEPLSSPLRAHALTTCYYTLHEEDELFGASYDAYSAPFEGFSLAHPEPAPDPCRWAITWAARSVATQTTDTPTITVLVVPKDPNARYMSYVDSETVHLVAHISYCRPNRPLNQLKDPWPEKLPPSLTLLAVTNAPGRDILNDRLTPRLQHALGWLTATECAQPRVHFPSPTARPPRAQAASDSAWARRHMERVRRHPPYAALCTERINFPAHLLTIPDDICCELDAMPWLQAKAELRYSPADCLYTDGSKIAKRCNKAEAGPGLGAAVYSPADDRTTLVAPNGDEYTLTITRAELAAIHAALEVGADRNTLNVFTDSAASIYLIKKAIEHPNLLIYSKHLPLLQAIVEQLRNRAHQQQATHILKVRAHTGVDGNEKADAGATSVSKGTAEPERTCDIDNKPLHHIWWIAREPNARMSIRHMVSDLNRGVTQTAPPEVHAGYSNDPSCTQLWREAAKDLDPAASNATLTRGRKVHSLFKRVFDYRYWQLWNAEIARRFKRPMHGSRVGPDGRAMCPVCKSAGDTGGHILGGCPHPDLHSCYIKRHNDAVQLIAHAIQRGEKGRSYMILDATAKDALPTYADDTRIPAWLLPALPEEERKKLRPDILIIPTLHPHEYATERDMIDAVTQTSTDGSDNKSKHPIHLLEVGYSGDLRHPAKQQEKEAQHATLAQHLRAAGWTVRYGTYEVVTLGTGGTIHKNLHVTLANLGVPHASIQAVSRELHHHAVHWFNKIVNLRRRLEKDPQVWKGPAIPLADRGGT
jgi:ribonuclease HI